MPAPRGICRGRLDRSRRRTSVCWPLLLGYYDPGGRLVFAARAGTGINQAELERLWRKLQPLATDTMPLAAPPPRNSRFGSPLVLSRVHWVRPELVAEVKYLTWTNDDLLRQVVYEGFARGQAGDRGAPLAAASRTCRLRPANSSVNTGILSSSRGIAAGAFDPSNCRPADAGFCRDPLLRRIRISAPRLDHPGALLRRTAGAGPSSRGPPSVRCRLFAQYATRSKSSGRYHARPVRREGCRQRRNNFFFFVHDHTLRHVILEESFIICFDDLL